MGRLIHRGYFKELFRQLMTAGIVSSGVLMLGNVSSLITRFISATSLSFPTASAIALPMKIFIYVMGLILPFSAFGWMNKRSRSDFYHSIPISRTQMFFTSLLVMALWMFIGIIAYAVVNALLNLLFGAPFNYLLFLCIVINMLISAVEVLAAVSLACALTGKRFVNIVTALVILFMPRLLLTALAGFINIAANGNIPSGTLSIFFDPSYNIIAVPYSFGSLITGVNVNYANVFAMLYTACYTALLIFLGWIAFKKRRSEIAGQTCSSRVVHALIRISLGIPLLIIAVFPLFLLDDISLAIIITPIFIVMSFVIYCLYELISTRSAVKMAKAMPLFLVCIAVAALYLVVPRWIANAELGIKIDRKDIRSYSVEKQENDLESLVESIFIDEGMIYGTSYEDLMRHTCKFDDSESLDIISRAFDRSYRESDELSSGYAGSTMIRIRRSSGRDLVRYLMLTESEMTKLENNMLLNERYAEAMSRFPDGIKYYACDSLAGSEASNIAAILAGEYESLSDSDKAQIQMYSEFDLFEQPSLKIAGCMGTENYYSQFNIGSLTPNAYKEYLRSLNEKNGAKVLKQLSELESWTRIGGKTRSFSIGVSGYANVRINSYMMSFNDQFDYEPSDNIDAVPISTDPEISEMIAILSHGTLTADDENSVIVKMNGFSGIGGLIGIEGAGSEIAATLKLSEQDLMRLNELITIFTNKEY